MLTDYRVCCSEIARWKLNFTTAYLARWGKGCEGHRLPSAGECRLQAVTERESKRLDTSAAVAVVHSSQCASGRRWDVTLTCQNDGVLDLVVGNVVCSRAQTLQQPAHVQQVPSMHAQLQHTAACRA
jgi:hypothetical protein